MYWSCLAADFCCIHRQPECQTLPASFEKQRETNISYAVALNSNICYGFLKRDYLISEEFVELTDYNFSLRFGNLLDFPCPCSAKGHDSQLGVIKMPNLTMCYQPKVHCGSKKLTHISQVLTKKITQKTNRQNMGFTWTSLPRPHPVQSLCCGRPEY